jgi:predicted O-methyltransferase YrrM
MKRQLRALWRRFPVDFRLAVRRRIPATLFNTLNKSLSVGKPRARPPLAGPPVAKIDLGAGDPIAAIVASKEYAACVDYFSRSDVRSLLSPQSRALLYQFVRLMGPTDVVEIGAHRGGTTEALARAVAATGWGKVYAVEPLTAHDTRAAVARWPKPLRAYVTVYPVSSMAFFMDMPGLNAGVYLIDGNHEYEYAAFDIAAAARCLAPGGFIFIDNISQHGPFAAAKDFLRRRPEFFECGGAITANPTRAFDRNRTRIPNTDFMIIRSGPFVLVYREPREFGQNLHPGNSVHGVMLDVDHCTGGTLCMQVVLRGFGRQPAEATASAAIELAPRSGPCHLDLPPTTIEGDYAYFTAELWLIWDGDQPLKLVGPPSVN